MADNDKFKIEQIDYFPNGDDKRTVILIKARSEYEAMIAESIYKKQFDLLGDKLLSVFISAEEYSIRLVDIETDSKDIAKAVVDRLFGEGK